MAQIRKWPFCYLLFNRFVTAPAILGLFRFGSPTPLAFCTCVWTSTHSGNPHAEDAANVFPELGEVSDSLFSKELRRYASAE